MTGCPCFLRLLSEADQVSKMVDHGDKIARRRTVKSVWFERESVAEQTHVKESTGAGCQQRVVALCDCMLLSGK